MKIADGKRVPDQMALPRWSQEHLKLAIDAAGVALWSWDVDTDRFVMDRHGYELWGVPLSGDVSFEDLSAHIHPADRDRVRAAFIATRAVTGAYEIDFRVMIEDEVRWVSARGQGDDNGIVGRTMFGIFLDVTGRKQAEEGHELLAGEMSHRVKNLLAVASGLTVITSRSAKTTKDMALELTQRLSALGRAHDLVRPLKEQEGKATLLGDLISVLLAPYDDLGAFSGRVRVSVPRMGVGPVAATTLALVLHELATNSLKHGALSIETGVLDVSCDPVGHELALVWTEQGGPTVVAPQGAEGFGSNLVLRAMSNQLGGSMERSWPGSGVIVTLRIDKSRLAL